MILERKLISGGYGDNDFYLRSLNQDDCTIEYKNWLNDTEVNQYLESKCLVHTLQSNLDFINMMNSSLDNYLFGIFLVNNDKHIGNIKLGPISKYYSKAPIGYMIGDKHYWRMGITTKAIGIMCEFAFKDLGLHRLEAGAYAAAVGSWRALEKNHFSREGICRDAVQLNQIYMDTYLYGLLAEEYNLYKK